jgi:hypothetical protein
MTGDGMDDTDASDGVATVHMNKDQGVWTNTGDDVLLLDANEDPVDYISFGTGTYVDPAPAGMTWSGTCAEVPEGYSLVRMPDGKDTDTPADFEKGWPSMGGPNLADMPPRITDHGLEPETPNDGEEVLVWALVEDEIALENVKVHVERSDDVDYEKDMTLIGTRYEVVLNGQPGGTVLMLRIIATDTGGNTNQTQVFNVTFSFEARPEIVIEVSGPGMAVVPGDEVKLTGRAYWSNGTMIAGTVRANIVSTVGNWSTDFNGFFTLWIEAPHLEGTYDVTLSVASGSDIATDTLELVVEWPHEGLEVKVLLGNTTIMTGDTVYVYGTVMFSDGLPAVGARVDIKVEGSNEKGNATVNNNGTYKLLLKAPSLAGNYTLEARSEAMGREAATTTWIDVEDNIMIVLREFPDFLLNKGQKARIKGQAWHHDGTPVKGSVVVMGIMNSTGKWRTYTDGGGNFSQEFNAPTFSDIYIMRISVVSGDHIATRTIMLQVRSEGPEIVPALDLSIGILAGIIAIVLVRRTGRRPGR